MHKLYQSLMGNRNVGQPINNTQASPILLKPVLFFRM